MRPPSLRRHEIAMHRWNAEVAGHVEHHKFSPAGVEGFGHGGKERIVEAREIDPGSPDAIVPPQRAGIAFDQLEEALLDRLFERVAGSAAVGIGLAEIVVARWAIAKIAKSRGQPDLAPMRQRPGRRPVDGTAGIERFGHPVEARP